MSLPEIFRPRASIEKIAASPPVMALAVTLAVDRLEGNAVAPGIDNFAIGDADGAALRYVQEPAGFRQRNSRAVENDAGDRNVIAARGRHH